jgi:hypothetical protein
MWIGFVAWVALTVAVFAWLLPAMQPRSLDGAFTAYGYLKDWQTALGAIIGFLGLMFVEIMRRTVERRDRRNALRDALGIEIAGMRESLETAKSNLEAALQGASGDPLALSSAQTAGLRTAQSLPVQGPGPDIGRLAPATRQAVLSFYNEHRRASGDIAALLSCLDPNAQDASFVRALAEAARKTMQEAIQLSEKALEEVGHRLEGTSNPEPGTPELAAGHGFVYACRWTGQGLAKCRSEHHT